MPMRDVNRVNMATNSPGVATPTDGDVPSGREFPDSPPLDAPDLDAPETAARFADLPPLCVDLDGTLIRTDTLLEGLIVLTGQLRLVSIMRGLASGSSALKAR